MRLRGTDSTDAPDSTQPDRNKNAENFFLAFHRRPESTGTPSIKQREKAASQGNAAF
ncbi:MAG: hypothetical protein FD176_2744 [Rhodospirillaceae bacterium]|nr:MAG: hypothetical protein FD176_2744 [Rhodospirillaceae bacterium]